MNFQSNYTPEEHAAEDLFEAQLKYTAEMITRLTTDHQHYTDDCGDYLTSALEISLNFAVQRAEGIDNFNRWLHSLVNSSEEFEEFDIKEFASDGISPAVYKFFSDNGKPIFED